MAEIVLNISQR